VSDPCDTCLAFLRSEEVPIVLEMSDGEMVYPAQYMANDINCDVRLVHKTLRRMREIGIAQSGPLFSEDDGKLCGRGTWLNRAGYQVQDILVAILTGEPT